MAHGPEWTGAAPHWRFGAHVRTSGYAPTEDPYGLSRGLKELFNEERGAPPHLNRRHFAPEYGQEASSRRLRHGSKAPESRVAREGGKKPIPFEVSNSPRPEGCRHFARVSNGEEALVESRMTRKHVARDPTTGRPRALTEAHELVYPEDPMGCHVKVPRGPRRRNGIPEVHAGDKPYGASEYCVGFFNNENYVAPQKLSRLAISWFRSAQNPNVDHSGRSISGYIQIYCLTPWRKLSMFAFKDAQVSELITNCGDGVEGSQLMFNGAILNPEGHLREYGIKRNSLVVLLNPSDKGEVRLTYSQQEALRVLAAEASEVKALDDWKPESQDEESAPPAAVPAKGKK